MKSEAKLMEMTIDCFNKNERIVENDKHRYEYE